mmetsp:Transcript_1714/g.3585  ORF Transcript_1714/g.3585 Transcript_1714/m.3585 type:complete len:203 (+) Transcript_1714:1129-1737(+)
MNSASSVCVPALERSMLTKAGCNLTVVPFLFKPSAFSFIVIALPLVLLASTALFVIGSVLIMSRDLPRSIVCCVYAVGGGAPSLSVPPPLLAPSEVASFAKEESASRRVLSIFARSSFARYLRVMSGRPSLEVGREDSNLGLFGLPLISSSEKPVSSISHEETAKRTPAWLPSLLYFFLLPPVFARVATACALFTSTQRELA